MSQHNATTATIRVDTKNGFYVEITPNDKAYEYTLHRLERQHGNLALFTIYNGATVSYVNTAKNLKEMYKILADVMQRPAHEIPSLSRQDSLPPAISCAQFAVQTGADAETCALLSTPSYSPKATGRSWQQHLVTCHA